MVITVRVDGTAVPSVLRDIEAVARRFPGSQTVRVHVLLAGEVEPTPGHTVTLGQGCNGSAGALMELAEFGEVVAGDAPADASVHRPPSDP